MARLLYQLYIWFTKVRDCLLTKQYLYTAAFAKWHELKRLTGDTLDGAHLFLAEGIFRHVLQVSPNHIQPELGNLLLVGKTRSGKGLNIETHLLTWPHSLIVNDIKGELYERTAGFRERLGGKVLVFDPRGRADRPCNPTAVVTISPLPNRGSRSTGGIPRRTGPSRFGRA